MERLPYRPSKISRSSANQCTYRFGYPTQAQSWLGSFNFSTSIRVGEASPTSHFSLDFTPWAKQVKTAKSLGDFSENHDKKSLEMSLDHMSSHVGLAPAAVSMLRDHLAKEMTGRARWAAGKQTKKPMQRRGIRPKALIVRSVLSEIIRVVSAEGIKVVPRILIYRSSARTVDSNS